MRLLTAIDSTGRVLFTVDAHRDNRKRFVVTADEMLSAFLELERIRRESLRFASQTFFLSRRHSIFMHFSAVGVSWFFSLSTLQRYAFFMAPSCESKTRT